MIESEGVRLLRILAEYNIPARTEVTYPLSFLEHRYRYDEKPIPKSLKNINSWSIQLWEDYCGDLMAVHGQRMMAEYWSK